MTILSKLMAESKVVGEIQVKVEAAQSQLDDEVDNLRDQLLQADMKIAEAKIEQRDLANNLQMRKKITKSGMELDGIASETFLINQNKKKKQ